MIEKLRQLGPVAWLIGNWQLAVAVAGAFALWSTALYWIGRDHGYEARVGEQAAARIKADKLEEQSRGAAAAAREADKAGIEANEEKRNDAIVDAGDAGAKPSASRNALNCQRMREAGRDVRHIPACGGRAPGGQAAPGR